jgi:hypothetical protein
VYSSQSARLIVECQRTRQVVSSPTLTIELKKGQQSL